jgi:hypothetical protein
MLPIVSVPATIATGMQHYRDVFCRDAGCAHVRRSVSGRMLSPPQPLQGMYAQQVWPAGGEVTRQAMHAAVLEAGWSSAALMQRHRAVLAREHRGCGREVIGVAWTLAHHERGPPSYGVKNA